MINLTTHPRINYFVTTMLFELSMLGKPEEILTLEFPGIDVSLIEAELNLLTDMEVATLASLDSPERESVLRGLADPLAFTLFVTTITSEIF